jgi:ubiquinone biosynthesis protein UbiJ
VEVESPLTVAQSVLEGKPPPVKIDGDVQLAAELAWLTENLRWDVEEDMSRILGDVPAHALAGAGRRMLEGLRDLAARMPRPASAASKTPASSPAPASPVTTWPPQAPGTGA